MIRWAGLPGVRDAARNNRQSDCAGREQGVILASVWRHAAGAGVDNRSAAREGARVAMCAWCHSPLMHVRLAQRKFHRARWYFSALDLRRTAPPNAAAVWQVVAARGDEFFSACLACAGAAALRALLGAEGNRVQGLIAPGHVCVWLVWTNITRSHANSVPIVVGGFEPRGSAGGDCHARRSTGIGPRRGREPVYALMCACKATSLRSGCWPMCWRFATANGAGWAKFRERIEDSREICCLGRGSEIRPD